MTRACRWHRGGGGRGGGDLAYAPIPPPADRRQRPAAYERPQPRGGLRRPRLPARGPTGRAGGSPDAVAANRPVLILGLNCFHADSAACLLQDGGRGRGRGGALPAHQALGGVPAEAIRYCLDEAGISVHDLDHVAINRDPNANLLKKALFSLRRRPSLELDPRPPQERGPRRSAADLLAATFDADPRRCKAKFHNVEHHLAHLASAFHVSPFERAAVVSVDGFGDFASAMWGVGRGTRIEVRGRVHFPHSLGLFYQAVTQLLGFSSYGDEYKVMGLAPYGEPTEMAAMRQIVGFLPSGGYELNLDCFRHHAEGVEMVWDGGAPEVGRIFTTNVRAARPAARHGAEITRHHKNVAASLQAMYEEAFFHLLNRSPRRPASGPVPRRRLRHELGRQRQGLRAHPLPDLYVQAAGDAGGAIGAAGAVRHSAARGPRWRNNSDGDRGDGSRRGARRSMR